MPTKAKETYIPDGVLSNLIYTRDVMGYSTKEELNKFINHNYPSVPRSTRTRWIRAFMAGVAHSETPSWHTRNEPSVGMIPVQYSDLQNGVWDYKRSTLGDEIRYVNLSCLHRPSGDGALLSLAAQLIRDFRPNLFPVHSDWLDADDFSSHTAQPHTTSLRGEKPRNRYAEFTRLTLETLDIFSPALPKNCLKISLWGNHENRILRHLLTVARTTADDDLAEYIVGDIFTKFQEAGILWLEPDQNRYLPITEHFWVCHGHKARTGEGATARAYMNQLKSAVSVAAGHTHRQEVVWSRTPRDEHFYAIAGTLGPLRPAYSHHDFHGHVHGFQFITHPFDGWRGATVEEVRIDYRDGYYVTNWRGREYSEAAAFQYDRLFNYVG